MESKLCEWIAYIYVYNMVYIWHNQPVNNKICVNTVVLKFHKYSA